MKSLINRMNEAVRLEGNNVTRTSFYVDFIDENDKIIFLSEKTRRKLGKMIKTTVNAK